MRCTQVRKGKSDMTVEEKICSVVEKMGNLNYVFDDLSGATYKVDSSPLPAFVNVMPVSGTVRVTPTMISYNPNCLFWIVDKIGIGEMGEGINAVVNRCMNWAYEFILTLNESRLFQPVENTDINIEVIAHEMNAHVAGVALSLQLRERQGLYLCGKPIKEYFKNDCNEGRSEEDNQ